ncbi:hypothetical protein MHBO_002470 [Bonamia ostreae]|uniref:Uncharacterized protein n=1 Tax=Bonamia ostreae TaxID=126728 RepID=A0ABV2AMV1_9EUKA
MVAERKRKRMRVLHGISAEDPAGDKIVKMGQPDDSENQKAESQVHETPPPPPNYDKSPSVLRPDSFEPKSSRMSEVLRPRMSASVDQEQKAAAAARYKLQQNFDPYNFSLADAKGAIETPPPPPPPVENKHVMIKMDYPHHYLMPDLNLQEFVGNLNKKVDSLNFVLEEVQKRVGKLERAMSGSGAEEEQKDPQTESQQDFGEDGERPTEVAEQQEAAEQSSAEERSAEAESRTLDKANENGE